MRKLKDALQVISYLSDVQILVFNEGPKKGLGEDEILFEGNVRDVPWVYAERELDNDSVDGESIFAFVNEKGNAIIGIYVMEE